MLSEVFWVAFCSTMSGLVIKLASMAYRSKCSDVSCCGIHIKRNVELETDEPETPKNNIV